MAKKHGFEWVGGGIEGVTGKVREGFENVLEVSKSSNWLMADTNFSVQARAFKKSGADMMIVSSHPFTTCGMLKEMKRQRIKPEVLVGLTSSSSAETLKGCSAAAERHVHPDRLRPDHGGRRKGRRRGRSQWRQRRSCTAPPPGRMRTSSSRVVESAGIMAKPETLEARPAQDARRTRSPGQGRRADGREIGRVQDEGESVKPYVFVQAQDGDWAVVHDPR